MDNEKDYYLTEAEIDKLREESIAVLEKMKEQLRRDDEEKNKKKSKND